MGAILDDLWMGGCCQEGCLRFLFQDTLMEGCSKDQRNLEAEDWVGHGPKTGQSAVQECAKAKTVLILKNLFNSVTNMSDVSSHFGFSPTFKLSAGRELQARAYKFAKRRRFLIGYLSQEVIYVLMWLDVLFTCPKLQLRAGPTVNKWWPYALMECALRSRGSRRESNQI
jgi:hypothetical protein